MCTAANADKPLQKIVRIRLLSLITLCPVVVEQSRSLLEHPPQRALQRPVKNRVMEKPRIWHQSVATMVNTCTQLQNMARRHRRALAEGGSSVIMTEFAKPVCNNIQSNPCLCEPRCFQILKHEPEHGISNLPHRCCMTVTEGPSLKPVPEQ